MTNPPVDPLLWDYVTHWLGQSAQRCPHYETVLRCGAGRMWTECLQCGHCTAGIQAHTTEQHS